MSVLVKEFEMPETCDECNFHRYHSDGEYVCVATPMLYPFNLANSKGIRKDWCPLVEVPTPHGRLIEVTDELLTALSNFIAETGIDEAPYMSASDWIEMNAPTVIEAEEGEDE